MNTKSWLSFCLMAVIAVGSSVDVSDESEFLALFNSNILKQSANVTLTAHFEVTNSTLSYEIPDGMELSLASSTNESYRITRLGGTAPFLLVQTGGRLELSQVEFYSSSDRNGGAISVEIDGVLEGNDVGFIKCNSTMMGGSIYTEGFVSLTNARFYGGTSAHNGGGVYAGNTSVTSLDGASFELMASTDESGGAIFNLGDFNLMGGRFTGNSAYYHGGDVKNGKKGNFTGSNSTFIDPSVSLGSGGCVHSRGTTSLTDVKIIRPYGYSKGGAISVMEGYTWLEEVYIVDANLETGSASSTGASVYLENAGTTVKANGLYMNTTDSNLYNGPHFDIGKGAGVYLDQDTVFNATNLICDGLAAASGPCIYAELASFTVIGGTVKRSFGFRTSDQAAAVYCDQSFCSLTDVDFISNRLNPQNNGQKGAAIYVLAADLLLDTVTFFNHSSIGSGGSVYVESSTVLGKDVTVSYSKAISGLGGFMYVQFSSVTIDGLIAHHCEAVAVDGSGGQGGVFAVDSSFKLKLKNSYLYDNAGEDGGAIYLSQTKDSDSVTTTALYFGTQIFDTVFERNNATEGGAVFGRQSIFYATGCRFTDNIATSATGSVVSLAPGDTIIQHSLIETNVEVAVNGTMLDIIRLALDNCTVTSNMGLGVAISTDSGSVDTTNGRYRSKTYYIMSRNSDLSGTRVGSPSLGNGFWSILSCDDSSGTREQWFPDNTIPSLVSAGVTFQPACPTSAECVADDSLKTFLCTCDESSFHPNIYNSDFSCLDADTSVAPTPFPTTSIVAVDDDAADDTAVAGNVTYTITDSAKVLDVSLDMSSLVITVAYGTVGLILIIFGITMAIDCAEFTGPKQEALEMRTFYVMKTAPALFHLLLCTDRKRWVDMVLAYEDVKEDTKKEERAGRKGKNGKLRKRHTKHKNKKEGDTLSPFADGQKPKKGRKKNKEEMKDDAEHLQTLL